MPFPIAGDPPHTGIQSAPLCLLHQQADSLPLGHRRHSWGIVAGMSQFWLIDLFLWLEPLFSPGEGNVNPLQYSRLENPMDRGYSPWGRKESDTTETLHFTFVIIVMHGDLPQGTLPLCLKRLTHSLPEVGHSRRYLQANVFHLGFPGGSVCKEPTGNSVDPSSVRVRKILWRSPWSTKESHRTAHACATMMQQFPAVSV